MILRVPYARNDLGRSRSASNISNKLNGIKSPMLQTAFTLSLKTKRLKLSAWSVYEKQKFFDAARYLQIFFMCTFFENHFYC